VICLPTVQDVHYIKNFFYIADYQRDALIYEYFLSKRKVCITNLQTKAIKTYEFISKLYFRGRQILAATSDSCANWDYKV
jgi:hypothetical protein